MANKKISQLTGATTPLAGTEELAIVQGGQTVKATAQDIADLGGLPYLVYTALLTQTGTDAPVITQVLENTTGATLSITRSGAGIYKGTFSSNILTTNKTILDIQTNSIFLAGQIAINRIINSTILPNSEFGITTSDTSYTPTEATFALANTFWIEIRVYP